MDGLDVIRKVREWSAVPVIVLSARGQEADKVAALDAGADDYLSKPFGVGELMARMRVALRHRARVSDGALESAFGVGELHVDLTARRVTVGGAQVHLTPIEYRLLVALVHHPGKVITHRQLLQEVWGPQSTEQAHYLRVYMAHLRRKLEADAARPRYLLTEAGVGYRPAAAGGGGARVQWPGEVSPSVLRRIAGGLLRRRRPARAERPGWARLGGRRRRGRPRREAPAGRRREAHGHPTPRDRRRPRPSHDAAARGTGGPAQPCQADRACRGAAGAALSDRRPLTVLRAPRARNRRRRLSARRLDVGLVSRGERKCLSTTFSVLPSPSRCSWSGARCRDPPIPVRGRPVTALAEP